MQQGGWSCPCSPTAAAACSSSGRERAGSPLAGGAARPARLAVGAAAAGAASSMPSSPAAVPGAWAGSGGSDDDDGDSSSGSEAAGMPLGPSQRSGSPQLGGSKQQRPSTAPAPTAAAAAAMRSSFRSGVRHAGWLWKRFGRDHKTSWKRLWFFLVDDRLCYCQADAGADSSSTGAARASLPGWAFASGGASSSGSSSAAWQRSSMPAAGGGAGSSARSTATAVSAAGLAGGQVRYIALDRIPVRPLPHRQHERGPCQRSHPDVGVAIIDASRLLTGQPASGPKRVVFSLVSGSHTHYLAADSLREAQAWVSLIRQTWLHCFAHTARSTGSAGAAAAGVALSQLLVAENALLRESLQALNSKVAAADGEYWRLWVEEKAHNQLLASQLCSSAVYEVLVATGSAKGAATDARVYLELFGPLDGSTAAAAAAAAASPPGSSAAGSAGACCGAGGGEVRLFDADSASKPFQRGALDTFTIRCGDVGLPARLRVWHDNSGRNPDWLLAEVRVRKQGSPRDWVVFPCNRWLSTQLDDGRICRELLAGGRPPLAYRVAVSTSDVRGAGTDANVFVQLHGLLGDGARQQLLGGVNDFERGKRDEFTIEDASELGELTAVTVGHDGSGKSPAWHLDHVAVTPLYGQQQPGAAGAGSCSWPGSPGAVPSAGSSRPGTPASPSAHGSSSFRSSGAGAACGPADVLLLSSGSGSLRSLRGRCSSGVLLPATPAPVPAAASAAPAAAGVTCLFPCGAWLDERLGDGQTFRRLPRASTLPSKAAYSIHITTSDVRGAGTDADVHLALTGSSGTSGLLTLPNGPKLFARGQTDTFRLQLPRLGTLQKLLLGHNGRGEAPSWHVALVQVFEEDSGASSFFAADRWLGASAPDGLCEVTLSASDSDPRAALVEYKLTFLTSPIRGAGTDSAVAFELHGERGSSGRTAVAAGSAAFARGGSDAFCYARPWLGALRQLRVSIDDSAAAPGRDPWHLEAVVVSCARDQQVVTFPCGRWLSGSEPQVVLTPGQAPGLMRYRFDVVTSSLRGAGTDGAVRLELVGSSTRAGPWLLDRVGALGRGQTDSFTVEGPDVGLPASLHVSLQATQASPAWHLSHVACTTLLDATEDGRRSTCFFAADRWFDAAHGLSAVLSASAAPPASTAASLLPYELHLFTSDLKGAGTDANVAVNLIGTDAAESGWVALQARPDSFERGREDVFQLLLPDVGQLTHLGVRSDGAGNGPAWHLDRACVVPPGGAQEQQQQQQQAKASRGQALSRAVTLASSLAAAAAGDAGAPAATHARAAGRPVWFAARRWLDAAHGLQVLLEAQARDPAASLAPYQVQVFTADIRNAGTDGRVFLQLLGERGSSPAAELQHSAAASAAASFQRGGVDAFTLQLPRLGALSGARLWLRDACGGAWRPELMVVTGPDGDVSYFSVSAWLGRPGEPGCEVVPLELRAQSSDPRQRLRDYKVVTRTSDLRGAGSDASVHVELFDTAGASSGLQQLPATSASAFQRGSVDTFSLQCCALGELARLGIRHDGSGSHPGWHLQQVEVTDVAAGRTWFFEADAWLDASQGDRKTERLLDASSTDPMADRQQYRVALHTSKQSDAGTGGAVFIRLHGSHGPPITSTAAASGTQAGSSSSASSSSRPLSSSRIELQASSAAAFAAGGVATFDLLPMRSLGQLRQLTLELEAPQDATCACSWHCQHVEVTSTRTGERWLFPCNTRLAVTTPAAAKHHQHQQQQQQQVVLHTAPSLDAMWRQLQQEQERQQEIFTVQLFTAADLPCAGACAAVALTLVGTAGEAGPFSLAPGSSSSSSFFQPGGCEQFEVRAPHKLGQLTHAKVACAGAGCSWFLDALAVTARGSTPLAAASSTWFAAGRWFDAAAGLSAVLDAAASGVDPRSSLVTYKVMTHTADAAGTGTDARVSVELQGAGGTSSGPQQLLQRCAADSSSSGRSFQRGQADAFMVRCRELGQLQQLAVWHDGSGTSPAWRLDRIEVQHSSTGQVWHFACGEWLGGPQGSARRLLQASGTPLTASYRVTVTTANVRGGSTDAAVHLAIHGARGDTGRLPLAPAPGAPHAAFSRGAVDEFLLQGVPDVGAMSHVVIGHDGSGCAPAWMLQGLEVTHLGSGQALKFSAHRWLDAKREGCSLECELWPDDGRQQQQASPQQQPQQQQAQVQWELQVVTGSVFGAGTDADVYVSLHGSAGSWGPQMLPAGPDAFELGQTDSFTLTTPELGRLQRLMIGHNNMGVGPAWFVERVELTHMSSGVRYVFRVAGWLDTQSGCSRTLNAVPAPAPGLGATGADAGAGAAASPPQQRQRISAGCGPGSLQDAASAAALAGSAALRLKGWLHASKLGQPGYKVTFTTSNIWCAGTSARIFFELIGEHGSSGVVLTPRQGGQHVRGGVAASLWPRLPYLGALRQLRVGCDGSGLFAAWHLEQVEVVHVQSGQRWLFDCHDWIDGRCGWQRLLPALAVSWPLEMLAAATPPATALLRAG